MRERGEWRRRSSETVMREEYLCVVETARSPGHDIMVNDRMRW